MAATWSVSGLYCEACNCEAACPCVMMGPPTSGDCTVLVGWHVEKGSFDGVALDGLNAALVAHSPGHMLKTKWKVALYLDERGSAAQQDALGKIFSGQAGGPLAALAAFIGEVLGVRPKKIEFRADGKRRSLRIEGVGQAEIEALAGQGGADVTLSNHPFSLVQGFPAVVSRSQKASFRDHGLVLDVSGKNGFYSPFQYRP